MKDIVKSFKNMVILIIFSFVSKNAIADNPDGAPPELYIYNKILKDYQNFECFMEFFQERRLPTGLFCRSIATELEFSMKSMGIEINDEEIKYIERKVFWRIRDDIGRLNGKVK